MDIHPKEIKGSWDQGFVLDVHTISSTMIGYNEFGHPEFDTVRSQLGNLSGFMCLKCAGPGTA